MRLITLFAHEEAGAKSSIRKKIYNSCLIMRQALSGFTGAFLLSSIFHLIIAILISATAVAYYPYSPTGNSLAPEKNDLNLFARALDELTREKGLQDELALIISQLQEEKLPEVAGNFMIMAEGMSEEEKIEIYKKLLGNFISRGTGASAGEKSPSEEIPQTGKGEGLAIRSGEKIFLSPSASGGGKSELYILSRKEAQELKKLEERGALKKSPGFGPGHLIDLLIGARIAQVPAQYYYRACPYEQIMARGAMNFSIVKGFPSFLFPQPEDISSQKKVEAVFSLSEQLFPQGNFRVIYYGETEFQEIKPGDGEQEKISSGDFRLARDKWARILDELMAYPEEIQFAIFEKEYLNKYNWNSPELADFTKSFINSNINGVIFIEDEFTSAFDALEELFYKKPIFERMAILVESYSPSPVRDELLFCLASSLDMERRVIHKLARTYPQARDIYLKKASLDHVFNSLPKAFVLKQVYEELRESLSRKGFSSLDEALDKYLEAELKIYEDLAGRGGQTRARALYAIGLTYWEKGEKEKAIETWSKIEKPYATYSIKNLLDVIDKTPSARLYDEIELEINYQSAKNTKYLYRRLVQFNKWSRRQKSI